MKKNARSKGPMSKTQNQKITSYFMKFNSQTVKAATSPSKTESIILSSDDEDNNIIDSPVKRIYQKSILEEVTNSPSSKKRKPAFPQQNNKIKKQCFESKIEEENFTELSDEPSSLSPILHKNNHSSFSKNISLNDISGFIKNKSQSPHKSHSFKPQTPSPPKPSKNSISKFFKGNPKSPNTSEISEFFKTNTQTCNTVEIPTKSEIAKEDLEVKKIVMEKKLEESPNKSKLEDNIQIAGFSKNKVDFECILSPKKISKSESNTRKNVESTSTEFMSPNAKKDFGHNQINSSPRTILARNSPKCTNKQLKTSKLEDSSNLKEVSPRKAMEASPKSAKKHITPNKRRAPGKLFSKSPNVNEFKVEIMEAFVKVTPSKSQEKNISPEMDVLDILEQSSSSNTENRSSDTQSENEKTPQNKIKHSSQTPLSSKVKIKLNFEKLKTRNGVKNGSPLKITSVANIEDNSKSSPISSKQNSQIPVEELLNSFTNDTTNYDDMFGDTFEENFQFLHKTLDLSSLQHCKILEIEKFHRKQVITVQSTSSNEEASCTLLDHWADLLLEVGCIINLSAIISTSSEWVIDNSNGMLVYEPDFLISSTSVVGSIFCKRKSVIKDIYGGFSNNKAMLIGTLVHSILQTCLRDNVQSLDGVMEIIRKHLEKKSTIFAIFETSVPKSELESELSSFSSRIVNFIKQYFSKNKGKFPPNINKGDWTGKIDDIEDIEENIWCPQLGIKGKVDVTVKADNHVLPLELKTGHSTTSLEHRGQVTLYIMMMNKLGYKVSSGLLLYLRKGIVTEVQANEREQRGIMMLRNELAYYLTRRPQFKTDFNSQESINSLCSTSNEEKKLVFATLPPPINHHSACARCEYNTICSVYLKQEDIDLNEYKHLRAIQEETIGHLNKAHIDYFMEFSALLAIENGSEKGKKVSDIYTKTPEIREKEGKCISEVRIKGKVTHHDGLYTTKFHKETAMNFLASGFGDRSYVVVSTDRRPAIATGIVKSIDPQTITIELDRNLSFSRWGEIFHLDTYDSIYSHSFNLTNLSMLLEHTERADQLRKLIIDKIKPTFKKSLPADVGKKSVKILKHMNRMQQRTVIKALAANDYLLIKGMPGTGKTATIVTLVQFLVELNQTVLLTSHTNSAIDNVCIRLQDRGIQFIRLGSSSRTHHRLNERSESELTKHCKTAEELEAVYNSFNVFVATCIGTKHSIFSKRVLDVCIVDESTQVLQSSLMRALYSTKKFILIGDPDQLPPIVKNQDAIKHGLAVSLFERLQSEESVISLTDNYRMNKVLTKLANDLTYRGQLLVANETTGNATIKLPKFENLQAIYNNKQWLLKTLDGSLENSVCVLDTGPVYDKVYGASWTQNQCFVEEENLLAKTNPSETAIVFSIVQALIKGGMSPNSIGIISPYRSQVAQISSVLADFKIDVNTVDQFQGQDKDVVVYSCNKTRDPQKSRSISKFEILEDKRRLTVAVTRAKHKLIMIADVTTMQEYKPFSDLFNKIKPKHFMKLTDGELGFNWEELVNECGV